MIQSEWFLSDITGMTVSTYDSDNFPNFPFNVLELYSKELTNIDIKNFKNNKNNLYIDTGLNMIGKKIEKNLFQE